MTDKVACAGCGAPILPDTAERTGGHCLRCTRYGPPRRDFAKDKTRRFGAANPEQMNLPFWRHMVETRHTAFAAITAVFGGKHRPEDSPIWSFQRFGATSTAIDGKIFAIGGEHEDHYDPDFCIYNDVVVFEPDGGFTIYGYPSDVFPPTDFHSATVVGDAIYIVGGLGYAEQRRVGATNVFRLDRRTLAIERLPTAGNGPGWIFEHEARAHAEQRAIVVSGGKVWTARDGKEAARDNTSRFMLDLDRGVWSRLEPGAGHGGLAR